MQKYFPEGKVMCFFREPIERSISNLKHLQRTIPHFQNKSLEEIAGINKDKPNNQIANMQARYIGNGTFEEKLKRIERFEFIGISEMYKESILLCNRTFGITLPSEIKENISPKTNEKISYELLDFLIFHNRQDMAFYTKAKQIFLDRYSKIK